MFVGSCSVLRIHPAYVSLDPVPSCTSAGGCQQAEEIATLGFITLTFEAELKVWASESCFSLCQQRHAWSSCLLCVWMHLFLSALGVLWDVKVECTVGKDLVLLPAAGYSQQQISEGTAGESKAVGAGTASLGAGVDVSYPCHPTAAWLVCGQWDASWEVLCGP